MIVLISSKQGGGKTALKNGLMNHFKTAASFSFADCPYLCHDAVKDILGAHGIVTKEKEKELVRELAEWARARFGIDIWVRTSLTKIKAIKAHGIDLIINDDLRFKHEINGVTEEIAGEKVVRIRLECPEEIRKQRCGENWREDTKHISEVDLDDSLSKFDLVIHTDTMSKDQTLSLALELIACRNI